MGRFLFGASLFLIPSLVLAAGFAKQSIFLSTTAPVEGQTILIHASVSNPATTTFSGTLVVKDEASEIGRVPVKLDAGGADDVSVSWKPTAGTHVIIADLKDANGTVIEEGRQTFTIAAPPSPASASPAKSAAPADGTGIQSAAPIQKSIDSISPTVGQYSSPVLKTIDSGRAAAATQLHTALDWSKSQIPTSSSQASSDSKNSFVQTAWKIFATVTLYVLTLLLYIVTNVGIFYPLLAVLFLYTLWRLWRRYRRR